MKKTMTVVGLLRLVVVGAGTLALFSCARRETGGMANGVVMQNASSKLMARRATAVSATAFDMDDVEVAREEAVAESGANGGAATHERKIVYSGNLHLEVQRLADTKATVEQWVTRYGGYISNASESETSASITANIPSASFAQAMEECGSFGRLKSKNTYTDDVTERFYDLDTRLSTRRVLLERLQTYLISAKTMQELIQIETKINDVTAELERMQGQMNRLAAQIDFSQITVYLALPINQTESAGFVLPSVRTAARTFLGDVASFFVAFVFVALKVIVFGVPCALFLMLLYWLAVGKVGLLRRLFMRIKSNGTAK